MAADANKSVSITALDLTSPFSALTTGEGAVGHLRVIDDVCAVTAAGIATVGSTYRLVRLPTYAKLKSFEIASDVAIDSNSTQALALDFNIVFSDSTIDGTPASLQGLIPTTARNGATTTFTSYSSPNKLFGTLTLSGNDAAIPLTNETYNGSHSTYNYMTLTQTPLWEIFGFTNSQGYPADPGGFFDIVAYVSVAAATGASGYLYSKVTYVA